MFVPSKLEAWAIVLKSLQCRLIEQVIDLLLVDLEVRAVNYESLLLEIRLLLDQVEQVMNSSWNDTISIHRMTGRGFIKVSIFSHYRNWYPFIVDFIFITLHSE